MKKIELPTLMVELIVLAAATGFLSHFLLVRLRTNSSQHIEADLNIMRRNAIEKAQKSGSNIYQFKLNIAPPPVKGP